MTFHNNQMAYKNLFTGPIAINVLKEGSSGRLNSIRRWDMTPATGKISEGQIDLDEDECPPAISIAGTDEDIMQVKFFSAQ